MHLYAVVLACSKTQDDINMTQDCIGSLKEHTNSPLTICVVETYTPAKHYNVDITIKPNEPFNFSRFSNMGFSRKPDNASLIGLFNNDLVFHTDWLDVAISKVDSWDSFSPVSPNWMHHKGVKSDTYGYGIGHEYCGWAVVMKEWLFDKIYPLDEQFAFWCSDNDMATRSDIEGARHLLIHDSKVTHLFSKSHKYVEDMHEATAGMVEKFNAKYGR